MASRGRGGSTMTSDWDPMRSEYEASVYETNDEEGSPYGQLDHCRLYVTNIPKALNEDGLRAAFAKYGTLLESHLSSDPHKRYALVKFETQGEAKIAMMKLNNTEPLKLHITIAYKQKLPNSQAKKKKGVRNNNTEKHSNTQSSVDLSQRDGDLINDNISVASSRRHDRPDTTNGDEDNYLAELEGLEELDPDLDLELERLRLRAAQLLFKQKLRDVKVAERRTVSSGFGSRCVTADGKIVVRTTASNDDRDRECETSGAGDSKRGRHCPCESWPDSSSGRSTPSTCVVCSTQPSGSTKPVYKENRKLKNKSDTTCELKYSDLFNSEEPDETDQLIKLRSADYSDIVDEDLKMVIAMVGYPKTKVRLQQMEVFKKTLADVIDMQLKAGLLKRTPVFLDYYINRGAIVCICKDMDTRDWMVRISQGLQERMNCELVLFKAKVKRLCLAVLRIPETTWPATAHDVFKLLQYFNPTLKTDTWKVYAQKTIDNVEYTSFLIDKVSGEIIRGPSFKNVIDYKQMEFELTGYTEIYYENFLSEGDEDIRSVASRVKLLDDIRSSEATPRNISEVNVVRDFKRDESQKSELESARSSKAVKVSENKDDTITVEKPGKDLKRELEMSLQKEVLQKLKNVQQYSDKEVVIWSGNTTNYSDQDEVSKETEHYYDSNMAATSIVAVSDKTESLIESTDNLLAKSSNVNIDSSRGIAYHRRTNYLHVENELKIAITLEGYPQNKLEGTHIRRLKHLFKEYLNKDMKQQRFTNLIIPKFHDIYLSNGAVIYICDSLETKDYLAEILPKFVHSTGLKLTFRDIKNLVRYTRIVMRLPKDYAHVESIDILQQLKLKYPDLKLDCWKYYSDVAGKQKRQFGVDPISLDVIKSANFDPTYEDEKLIFRIIDRQKRDVSYEDSSRKETEDSEEAKKLRERVLKAMHCPINPDITNAPLTRIRTNHYSDLIADDLKMYVGPSNYPETRVDEHLFHTFKRYLENILCEAIGRGDIAEESVPKYHDMYLFDGVIFIICVDFASRNWVDEVLPSVSDRVGIHLKSTEYRGAVGIISMYVATTKDTDEVIEVLQKQNPRLRTKYWRKISTVKTKTKLDVVLQIDKLSAQVITDPGFNSRVGENVVQFKLGHLQSLIKPKQSLEELTKKSKKSSRKSSKTKLAIKSAFTMQLPRNKSYKDVQETLKKTHPNIKTESWTIVRAKDNLVDVEIDKSSAKQLKKQNYKINDVLFTRSEVKQSVQAVETPRSDEKIPSKIASQTCHVTLKVPQNIMPDTDDLQVILDLLEDNNPGLNTELWNVVDVKEYGNREVYHMVIDKQSATVIQSKRFNSVIAGEKIKFLIDN